jgi:hypothetical protein
MIMKKFLLTFFSAIMAFFAGAQFTLYEDFEGGSIPQGWTLIDEGTNPGTWQWDNYSAHSGNGHISVDCYDADSENSGRANDWIITPKIMVVAGEKLSFYAASSNADYPDNLNVFISKNGTAEADFSISVATIESIPAEYTMYSYVLSDIEGVSEGDTVYIGFQCNSNGSFMNLDDIVVANPAGQLIEDFEGGQIPAGWTLIDEGTNPGTWFWDNYAANSGVGHISVDCFDADSENSGRASDWIITPKLKVMENEKLSFYAASSNADYKDDLSVKISKTGTVKEDFTITVAELKELPTGYTKYEFMFSEIADIAPGDEIYIGFYCNSNGSFMNIDDVMVSVASGQLEEDFEEGIPSTWILIDNGQNNMAWADTLGAGLDNTNGVWVDCYEDGLDNSGRANDWLITPSFVFNSSDVLSFWLYGNDADYRDTVIVALSAGEAVVEDFTVFLDTIITTTDWTKYQYSFGEVAGVNNGQNVFVGIWALSNGSRVFLDKLRVGGVTAPKVFDVYAIGNSQLAVVYDAAINIADVDPATFTLSGSQELTFTEVSAHPENEKIVILTTSEAMASDGILDKLVESSAAVEKEFYAGITPIAFARVTNPEGTLQGGFNATFKGIVSDTTTSRVWLADADGPYTGVNTYDMAGNEVSEGDEILIYGSVDHYQNQTEIYPATLIEVVSSGNAPFGPFNIMGADISLINDADSDPAEKYEGAFVEIKNASVISYDGEYYLCSDDDGANNFYVGDRFGIYDGDFSTALTEGGTFNISGIITGRSEEYLLAPRKPEDISLATSVEIAAENEVLIYPNPFKNQFYMLNTESVLDISVTNILGQRIKHVLNRGLNTVNIDLTGYEQGIYIITYRDLENNLTSKRIIKE